MNPDLSAAYIMARKIILQADDAGHMLREQAFYRWKTESLFPQAVALWIATIGAKSCNKP